MSALVRLCEMLGFISLVLSLVKRKLIKEKYFAMD